ncbi:MAG: transposase [bacterium]|nr:transposase [bacterium]
MRVEPRVVGSIAHIVKRGTRGMNIVRDERDRLRFSSSILLLNDSFADPNWSDALREPGRPDHWPEQDPLVHILAWTLMPNHFHLLLEEIRKGGIAKFMQRLCGSMSAAFNAKYSETGSMFQGAYKSKTVADDTYLRYLTFYIQVKNVLELFPGGLKQATRDFDQAWEWALSYPFSSLPAYAGGVASPIVESKRLLELYPERMDFKKEAREMLITHLEHHDDTLSSLMLEPW